MVRGLIVFLAISLSINALTYINFDSTYGFLKLKQQAIATGWYLPAYYAHVLAAGIILLVGLLQLSDLIRLRWLYLHRSLGKIYVFGILFFAAPGGLMMSFFIGRGPWVLASFLLQCSLWFYFTLRAFIAIRKGDVPTHREWMLRSFALTFAAITLRLYVFISSWSFDLSQPAAYGVIAWMSWTLNLVAIEFYIRRKSTRLS